MGMICYIDGIFPYIAHIIHLSSIYIYVYIYICHIYHIIWIRHRMETDLTCESLSRASMLMIPCSQGMPGPPARGLGKVCRGTSKKRCQASGGKP